jgi:hypothetical protein
MENYYYIIKKYANKCGDKTLGVKDLIKVLDTDYKKYSDLEIQQLKSCAITNLLEKYKIKSYDALVRCSQDIQQEIEVEPLSSGEQGETMMMIVRDDVFSIVKFSYTEDAEILHEIAVGLILNTLREVAPNFMYMYGGVVCTIPFNRELQNKINDLQADIITLVNKYNRGVFESLYENIDKEEIEKFLELEDMTNFIKYLPILRQKLIKVNIKRSIKVYNDLIFSLEKLLQTCVSYPENLENIIKWLLEEMIEVFETDLKPKILELETLIKKPLYNNALLCANDNVNVMFFAEYINGSSLSSFFDKQYKDSELIATLVLQVLLSCVIAYNKYGYNHNDLHTENIFVEKKPNQTITYILENQSITLKCKYIARIIDYGLSEMSFDDTTLKPVSPFYKPNKMQFVSLKRLIKNIKSNQKSESIILLLEKCFTLNNNYKAITELLLNALV